MVSGGTSPPVFLRETSGKTFRFVAAFLLFWGVCVCCGASVIIRAVLMTDERRHLSLLLSGKERRWRKETATQGKEFL